MNAVYVRMVFYFLAPLLSMVPGITYDSIAQTILIDIETAAMGIAGSAVLTGAVFAKWGAK
ncbi:MAG: hypothetical protein ACU0CT_03505 [Paracoccaceae bacterium]